MDWKVVIAAFVMVFLAEMGDKTQWAVLSMSSDRAAPFSVWVGATLALAASSAIAAAASGLVRHWMSSPLVRYVPGILFILIGCLMLLGRLS